MKTNPTKRYVNAHITKRKVIIELADGVVGYIGVIECPKDVRVEIWDYTD